MLNTDFRLIFLIDADGFASSRSRRFQNVGLPRITPNTSHARYRLPAPALGLLSPYFFFFVTLEMISSLLKRRLLRPPDA